MEKNLLSFVQKNKILLLFMLCFTAQPVFSTILYVDSASIAVNPNGLSWATAYPKLETAISNAASGDQIWVAKGTYSPVQGTSYRMKNNLEIYGGFLNGAVSFNERNVAAHLTLLKGNNNGAISNSVINNRDIGRSAILDGFTITGITNLPGMSGGAGMFNYAASPTIRNVIFKDNINIGEGDKGGGAMFNTMNSSPILTNVKFINNKSKSIQDYARGGAVFNYNGSSPVFDHVIFSGNKCESGVNGQAYGGAIYSEGGSTRLNNVVFDDNESLSITAAGSQGGAIFGYVTDMKITNTVFTNNRAWYGTMIRGYKGSFSLVHVTGYKNLYTNPNGSSQFQGMSMDDSKLQIANSIFMSNNYYVFTIAKTTIENSLIDNTTGPFTANINVNDLPFINPNNPAGADNTWFTPDDGLRISNEAKTTPLDKGKVLTTPEYDAAMVDSVKKDILGAVRPQGAASDIGAYEGVVFKQIIYVDSANTNGIHDGLSWETAFNKLEDALLQSVLAPSFLWVAKGTYSPPQNQSYKMSRFHNVYGGFTNGDTELSQRNWKINSTILKGSGAGVIESDYPVDPNAIVSTALLDGFTITGGVNEKGGAGMFIKNASPELKNIVFIDNITSGSGGALYLEGSGSILSNITFKNNTADNNGGALYTTNSKSSSVYRDLTFSNNTAKNGGAIAQESNSFDTELINVVFQDNHAVQGGAVYNISARQSMANAVFAGNTADATATIYNDTDASTALIHATFSKNIAADNNLLSANSTVVNGVMWGNSSISPGTFSYSRAEHPLNSDPSNLLISSSPFINEDLVEGPDGIWKTADDGLQLKPDPITVTAATKETGGLSGFGSTVLLESINDILGTNRNKDGLYDIGAYEYLSPNFTRYYVDLLSTSPLKNGGSWTYAYSTLEQALNDPNIGAGDSIWVAKGTYKSTAGRSLVMKESVKIYGGFLNTATDQSERDFVANETILKGNFSPVIVNNFTVNNPMTANSVLDGFTVTEGGGPGAGIKNNYASPTLRNLIIKDNDAGGGNGGGLWLSNHSNSLLENVVIKNNDSGTGGGVYLDFYSMPILKDVVIDNNTATYGGGMSIESNSIPTLKNVVISNNEANYLGGGIDIYSASANLDAVVFSGNMARWGSGGGLSMSGSTIPVIANNVVFYKNTAYDGAGYYSSWGDAKFTNATFAENAVDGSGGGLYSDTYGDGSTTVVNSVFWGNTGGDLEGPDFTINATFTQQDFTSSGTGNIKGANAPFMSVTNAIGEDGLWFTADDGLQPAKASPIINAGVNAASENILMDIAGRSRIMDVTVDMGAYEAYPNSDASLISLALSDGTLDPVFSAANTVYHAEVLNEVDAISITALFSNATAKVRINNEAFSSLTSGTASASLNLSVGSNPIEIIVKAADSVSVKTYTVNVLRAKASAALSLSNLSATYDGTAKSVTVSTNPSGLSGVFITYNGSATAPTVAGTYAVVAKLTHDSYIATDVTGNLVISKGNQTISFPNFTNRKTNSPDFEPGASVNTSLPLTYSSTNTSVAVVFQDASDGNKWKIRITGEGTASITAAQAGSANYESASVSRTLVIEPVTLPVSLTAYHAKKEANRVQLTWTTASEKDNDYFEIQRSFDGQNFQRLTTLKASGNSSANKNYVLYDYAPAHGDNYYRLVQYDINGNRQVLGDRIVNFNIATAVSVSVFPNPAVDEVNLNFTGFLKESANVVIIDLSGRIVHRETVRLNSGETVCKLTLENKLIPGQYIINVNGEGLKASLTLVVAR